MTLYLVISLVILKVQDVDGSQMQQPMGSSQATVYDFYEIDKCFPPTNPHENVMAGEEQRLIPIYVCKPIRQIVKMVAPEQRKKEEILRELDQIDQMEIRVVELPPKRKSDNSRKTRLIPLAFVSERGDVLMVKGENNKEVFEGEEKRVEVKVDELLIDLIKTEKEIDIATPADEVPVIPVQAASPARSESPEKPQFQCDKCDKRFYMKRVLLRHMYSHK